MSDDRASVIEDNADLLMSVWHNLAFGDPHKDGIRQAATLLYNVAHVARAGEVDPYPLHLTGALVCGDVFELWSAAYECELDADHTGAHQGHLRGSLHVWEAD